MRGIELRVNVMVILVIAVIVMFSILALFLGIWSPFQQAISPDAAKYNACLKLMTTTADCHTASLSDIHINDFDVDGNGFAGSPGDTLKALCASKYFNIQGDDKCRELCGCK